MMGSPARGAVLVTGANRGIGFEICRLLAGVEECSDGLPPFSEIVMAGRDPSRVATSAAKIREIASGRNVTISELKLDVSDPDSINKAMQKLEELFGEAENARRLCAVVNNAGVLMSPWDERTLREAHVTNVRGALLISQKVMPLLKMSSMSDGCSPPRIVNVSSGFGMMKMLPSDLGKRIQAIDSIEAILKGLPFEEALEKDFPRPTGSRLTEMVPTYKLTKALLNRGTHLMAKENAGVCMNVVCPGWCATDMGCRAGNGPPRTATDGAKSVMAALLMPPPFVSGKFFRDGKEIPW